MKTENKKVNDFFALENVEELKEFEMIELKGGNSVSTMSTNLFCTQTNTNCDCTHYNKDCFSNPLLKYCSIVYCY